MSVFAKSITFTFILCAAMMTTAVAQDSTTNVDWSNPDSIDVLQPDIGDFLDVDLAALEKIATDAYQAGEWEKAAKYYLALLRYDISDSGNIYNLACCYGLMGEAELAAKYLERAYRAGFTDIEHISWDPDFDSVRQSDAWQTAFQNLSQIAAEKEAGLGSLAFVESPALFESRIMLPENFDPDESHTLVVGLHGLGSNPDRFVGIYQRFGNPDFIFVTPRAPYPFSVGNEIGYSWAASDENDESVWPRSATDTEDYVVSIVNEMKSRFNIGKVYLLGFSQGCGFTYMTGIQHHELFDGLICFGGWLDTDWISGEEIAEAASLRVFIGHGTQDRMVEFETGVEARDTLEAAGYDVTFYEFDGAHAVPEEMCLAVNEWLNE